MATKYVRPQVILLALINLLLITLMVYEVTVLQPQEPSVMVEEVAPIEIAIATHGGKANAVRRVEDYAEVLDRPLFNRERRPLVQEESELSEEEARAFSLVGVVLTPEQQVAILYSRQQQQPVKVALWDWIEGWRLVSVKANVVELRKGKHSLELTLQRNSQKDAEK